METEAALPIGATARLAGLTVRTLHHYDDIGLVSPSQRTTSGYRLYGRQQIERLREVLFPREIGMALDDIQQVMDEPNHQRQEALGKQRRLLIAKAEQLLATVELIDRTLEVDGKGILMKPEEMLDVFGNFDPAEHHAEAEERWGGTDAWTESDRRVASYTKTDWLQIKDESTAINRQFLDLMAKDIAADSVAARGLAEVHRNHISKWFYDCTPEIHAGLGQMYVSDLRFKENIDKEAEGLAEYLSAAIAANEQPDEAP